MNIGTTARQTGLPPKTVCYYKDIGLLAADQAANGYRDCTSEDVHRLRFVQRSRSLGFSVEKRRRLLSLHTDRDRASADMKAIATKKLGEIDGKLAELTGLRDMLGQLVENYHSDARPECPIIDGLAASARPI
jgi:MerR family transcriptional regulator, copper efflux regulator